MGRREADPTLGIYGEEALKHSLWPACAAKIVLLKQWLPKQLIARREFGREVEPLDLNAAQAAVMIALATQARTAADLSRALTHDAGAMTRVVDQLEEPALVRRVRLERDLPPPARRAHGRRPRDARAARSAADRFA